MLQILEIANKHKVPIIADEVYYGLSFDESRPFYSFGNVTKDVPVIVSFFIFKSLVYFCYF